MVKVKEIHLPTGKAVPVLGIGTWEMAEDPKKRAKEIEALRLGLDLGMSLIDTAEIYGNGKSEELIAEAIGDRRKEYYLVSKIFPQNATLKGTLIACENSLRRLKTDHLDLYLLHWRGSVPLEETFQAFQKLKDKGMIIDFGVSNFDVDDMEEAFTTPGGNQIASNQVLYNLKARGIELDLLPFCQNRDIPIMAYTPLGHRGRLYHHPLLKKIAERHSATPAQIALAWVLRQKKVLTIPKASSPEHMKENFNSLKIKLTSEDLSDLDKEFPPPSKKIPLETV
jgi:diketogulonate reductase-like aldo/keto reductase